MQVPSRILSFFSIFDLLKTLFSPFRQDALETKGAPLNIKLQALGGNIISRIFGFIIRTALIMTGLVMLIVSYALGLIVVLLWPLLPLMPLVVIVLTINKVGA